ncbi:carcinoembryonic antigen-related cell adhesion molecule 7-like isoform X1 [Rhinatrema bivittatum]|uniref:carcinoembryonic antigen-related cell adhesion molecule 7-like isoform X1 n=1 Tax=Rhinatrema bivittatum TaxID=194408 RepID=UPI00112D7281|nr:carcinoembryonic antigen-related cell adhesion molecule 7-like isoform X1 [Rhinatrema bivittatum]
MEFVFCRWCPAVLSFFLTVFLGFWSRQISAQISVVPIPKILAEGSSVLLSVSVTGRIITITWYRGETVGNNQILLYVPNDDPPETVSPPYVGRVRGFPNGSMEISGLTTSDSGSYTVQIQTQSPPPPTATVNITVSGRVTKPTIQALTHSPVENGPLTLRCNSSDPHVSYLWYKEDKVVLNGRRINLTDNNQTLTLFPSSRSDSGSNYTCGVTNAVSNASSNPYLLLISYILGKPSIMASLSQPVEYRDSVTLICGTSSTIQTILWYKERQSLPSNDRMSLSPDNRTLTISNVSIADSGSYRCEVINPVSRSTSDPYTLTVYSTSTEGTSNAGPIIGATVGAVLGAVLLITTAVLFYKKYSQRRKNGVEENMYDVPDMKEAPSSLYQNIIPQNPGGSPINTLNSTASDSAYMDLQFRSQSVYSELKK